MTWAVSTAENREDKMQKTRAGKVILRQESSIN